MSKSDVVEEDLNNMQAWRKIDKKLFFLVPETYYLATPYLRLLRDERNWSIREISERAGVSTTYYHKFEQGKVRAGEDFIKKIRKVFNEGGSLSK